MVKNIMATNTIQTYKLLLKTLEKYNVRLVGDKLQFTCPKFKQRTEFIANLSCNNENKELSIEFSYGKITIMVMIIKEDLIQTFHEIIETGILQTAKMLCTEFNFDAFTVPYSAVPLNALIYDSGGLKISKQELITLNEFDITCNGDIKFRSPFYKMMVTINHDDLKSYFSTLFFKRKYFERGILHFRDLINLRNSRMLPKSITFSDPLCLDLPIKNYCYMNIVYRGIKLKIHMDDCMSYYIQFLNEKFYSIDSVIKCIDSLSDILEIINPTNTTCGGIDIKNIKENDHGNCLSCHVLTLHNNNIKEKKCL